MKKAIKLNDQEETRWVIDDISSYYKEENSNSNIIRPKYKIMITSTSIDGKSRDHLWYDKELIRDKDLERLDQYFDFMEPDDNSVLP